MTSTSATSDHRPKPHPNARPQSTPQLNPQPTQQPHPKPRPPAPAAVTGLGAVTPIGINLQAFAAGLRAGATGIRLLDERTPGFNHPKLKSTVAAFCDDFDPASVMPAADIARFPALIPMALEAATQAARQAGITNLGEHDARRTGLVLGTGGGGIDFTLEQARLHHENKRTSLWTITNATHGNLAGELSIRLGLKGPSVCVSDGCASGSDAAALALAWLREDRARELDRVVVVAADAHIRAETLMGMELLGVITQRNYRENPEAAHRASKPFDEQRDGFVLGEGAWAIVLERPETAQERTLAQLRGAAQTCDAYHRVRPDPTLAETVRAMHNAIADAGLTPKDISLVHYHGTATPLNDVQETKATHAAFGNHAKSLIGTSVKGAIGHPQGASGLAAAVATLAAMLDADNASTPFAPPTAGLETPGEGCDLNYTPHAPTPLQPGRHNALINCLAFGAKNTALVVSADITASA